MNSTVSHVPPGFRFHPTEEELVNYYLRKKVASRSIDLDVIRDVDLYNIEPWDLQELCKIGNEEQNEWYFFSHKDKKYPTGTRTNRATKAGFWKATGRDKSIYSKHSLIGMRKTLVFYKGRAPNGLKSDWIMHEYRLETNENATSQEEGWVACRVFKKRMTTMWKAGGNESTCWYDDDQASLFMKDLGFPNPTTQPHASPHGLHHYYNRSCKQELDHRLHHNAPHDTILHLPHLESPKLLPQSVANSAALYTLTFDRNDGKTLQSSMPTQDQEQVHLHVQPTNFQEVADQQATDQMTDWRVLDKFVASQLSHEGAAAKLSSLPNIASFHVDDDEYIYSDSNRTGTASGYTSFSIPSCQVDLWK